RRPRQPEGVACGARLGRCAKRRGSCTLLHRCRRAWSRGHMACPTRITRAGTAIGLSRARTMVVGGDALNAVARAELRLLANPGARRRWISAAPGVSTPIQSVPL